MISIAFLAVMIFSLTYLSKDNFESSVRPKYFSSLNFGTIDSLKKSGDLGCFSYDENRRSLACLLRSGLNFIFH